MFVMRRRVCLLTVMVMVLWLAGCASSDAGRFGTFVRDQDGLFAVLAAEVASKIQEEVSPDRSALRVWSDEQVGFGHALAVAAQQAGYKVYSQERAPKGAEPSVDVGFAVDYLGAPEVVRLCLELGPVRLGRVFGVEGGRAVPMGPWSRTVVSP